MSPSQDNKLSQDQMAAWREYLKDVPPSAFPRRSNLESSPVPSSFLRRKIALPTSKSLADIDTETLIQTAWALVNIYYSDTDDVIYGVTVVDDADSDAAATTTTTTTTTTTGTSPATTLSALPARFRFEPTETVAACLQATEAARMLSAASLGDIAALSPAARTATQFDNQLVIFSDMGGQDVQMDRAVNIECTISRRFVMARAFYDASVVDSVQMQRVLGTFEALILQLGDAANQTKTLADLQPVCPADLAQLAEWNKTLPPRVDECMHNLVARKVQEHPDKEAVCALGISWTYAQLDDMSERLAHVLVSKGARPGTIVPFMFEKNPWTIVTMLATLKAGAAFVPFDPAHQWADTAGLLEATRARFVLCSPLHQQRFVEHGVDALVIDTAYMSSLPPLTHGRRVNSPVQPSDPGYVIFSSGSTGVPKGIICPHDAWCTNVLAYGPSELAGPDTRALQFCNYVFDMSISDVFTTLTFGGCVCVPTESERVNDISGAARRMAVTQLVLTPTVVQLLRPDDFPSVKVLLCGGEPLTADLVAAWADKVDLVNSYGPAETTARGSCRVIRPGDVATNIGTADGGVLWVAQSNNPDRLVPIGAVGELLIEGHTLAAGYLGLEAKTRESFIDAPQWLRDAFPERAAGKVYRTGDLVVQCSDGSYVCLGRRDTQIKIHGVRLECGHIESKIIAALPEDASVVVEKIVVAGGKQLLAAFLTLPQFAAASVVDSASGSTLLENTPEIRQFISNLQQKLLGQLQSYMVPNVFLPVTSIPLGQTGKTNRRALKALAASIPEDSLNQFAASRSEDVDASDKPRTGTESTLASMWADILRVPSTSIGRHGSFFNLGGDSVSAMKLVAVAADRGLALTVVDIFQAPKLADLAQRLEDSATSAGSSSAAVAQDLPSLDAFELIGGVEKFRHLSEQLYREYSISPRNVDDIYPCAPMQESMMAETIAAPEAYVLQTVFKLARDADLDRLQDAWTDAYAQYPILRTRIGLFKDVGSCQIVMSEHEMPVWAQARGLSAYLAADKTNPMGYGDALCRFATIESDDGSDDRFLVWTAHHAITDGLMKHDIVARVEAAYGGEPLKDSTPFNHFVKYLQDQDVVASQAYWKAQFSGVSGAQFPQFDDSHEPCLTHYFDRSIPLPRDTVGFTPSILLRAAWAFVLAHAANSTDVVLGITQSGRDISLRGIEECLGPCLTTAPLRVSVDSGNTVSGFLSAVQEQYIGMIPHQHTGLRHIRKASPEAADACALHNLLVIQPASTKESALLELVDMGSADDQLSFGLLLECFLGQGEVRIHAGYDDKVLPASAVEALVHRLEHVLAQLGSQRCQSMLLSTIDLTSPADIATLEAFNPEVEPLEKCMHWLVEEQARQRPDALAVDAWDAQLTFGQLLDYSDRLAGRLVSLGVQPDSIVPFAFEKSAWTTVAIHAILRAGGACVALDMSHPRSRHETILADTDARVIVASTKHASNIDLGPHVVAVDRSILNDLPPRPISTRSNVGPHNLAFAVYSSGSTGKPKASLLTHRSLCTTSRTNSDILGVAPGTRAIGFASHSFDVAIEENIIIPMYGGCVCIPSDEERLSDLPGAMRRMNVNWADLTPTVGRMLTPENVPCLRTLVLGGESLTKDIIDTWASKINLFNTYGPSECSIQCTASQSLESAATGANIGRAVNCKLWVVDAEDPNRLLPPGSVGELLIEGPIVGRGYLKEPAKTKAAFVSGLAWAVKGKKTLTPRRFYRTGDLAKFNPDGTLDCLGRLDTQIKLHGQRIELGEIEYNIKKRSRRPETATVAVEAFAPKGSSRKLLAAFIQSIDATSPDLVLSEVTDASRAELEQLKADVGRDMPEYMVPALFVPVVSLPMNTSGKIDRKKLREAASGFDQSQLALYSLAKAETTKSALSSPVEKQLAALWAEVLHIDLNKDPIGASDGFLELGGDSITAMHLAGKAKAAGLALSVPMILRSPRLADMALAVKPIPGVAPPAPTRAANAVITATTPSSAVVNKPVTTVPPPQQTAAVVPAAPSPAQPFRAPVEQPVVVSPLPVQEPTRYSAFQLLSDKVTIREAMRIIRDKYDIEQDMVEDMYPCTPLQEGLMALTATSSAAYVLRDIYTLPAGTDVDQFKAAWSAVVRRNSILRTRVAFVEGLGSCQVVLDERLKWRSAESVDDYLDRDRAEPMGYGTPLSRWALVDDGKSIKFVWSIHHALYDGFSLGLTLNAVDHAYHNELAVPELKPFTDFIRFLQGTDKEDEKKFWTEQFANLETAAFPQPSAGHQPQIDNSTTHTMSLPKGSRTGLTTATILKAAWSIVVSRVSDSSDVVFGVTTVGRDADIDDAELINGPTIATVPLRVRANPESPLKEFLASVQAQSLDMISYSHTGLQNIRKMSDAAQEACGFQNLLVIQPAEEDEDAESVFKNHQAATLPTNLKGFSLAVECALGAGKVSFRAGYDSKVMIAAEADRLLRQFEHVILQLLLAEPQRVGDVDMFSAADRQAVAEWNGTFPKDVNRCMHDIIAEQVAKTPNAAAVQSRETSLTYQDLADLSTDLAHQLRSLGVGPDVIVPICLEKSTNGVISMLAIQKAGGAFVPLNPQDPTERLLDLIDQVDASVLIFSEQTKHLIPTLAAGKSTIILPALVNDWDKPLNTAPVVSGVQPMNLAYTLFTSGSTGRPKAVMIHHRSLSSSTSNHGPVFGFADFPRRVLQFATYTFDVCIGEIFTTLIHGGCICIPSEHDRMNDIGGFIRDFKCDVVSLTPSYVRLLKPEDVPSLKTLILGGEALPKECVDVWGDRVQLINGYGPTECCTVCVIRLVPGPSQNSRHKPEAIGHPVGVLGWVVDAKDHTKLVPTGCIGELVTQGPCLARGYLKNPEKTAEAFVDAPAWLASFGYTEPQKIYKTGDLVRQDVLDGTLTYLGRKDNQTKVNGQRLELGEIETQLKERGTKIEAAVVLAGKTKLDKKRQVLAAFIEFTDSLKGSTGVLVDIDEILRTKLQALECAMRASLPKYMVPSLWIPVTKMPHLTSGKTDRKTLAALFRDLEADKLSMYALAHPPETAEGSDRPPTDTEAVLIDLIAKSLGREAATIRPHNNFLRLGGDSIIAIQLIAAAAAAGLTLTAEDIFRQPTISDMAKNAEAAGEPSTESDLSVIAPFSLLAQENKEDICSSVETEYGIAHSAISDILPCTPLQEGLVALTVKDSEAYVLRQIFRLPSKLDLSRFREAWDVVVRDAAILRTRIVNIDPYGSLQVVMGQGVEWQTARSVKEYIDHDNAHPFGYGVPLCKFGLVETLYNGTYFIWTIHHSLYDGWSHGLMLSKVQEAYLSTSPQPTIEPTPPFNRFIQFLQRTDATELRDYWKGQFVGLEAQPFPRIPASYEPLLDRHQSLDIPLTRRAGSAFTTGTLLKAGWAIVLGRYSGSSDSLFGLIQAGRNVPVGGVAEMMGPTITTVPLRVKLDSAVTVSSFLQSIQDQSTEMIKYEHAGLQNISRMGPECREACALSNIMAIQPGGQGETEFLGAQRIQDQDKAFLRFGLSLECVLQDGAVQVTGSYDQRLLADSQMQRILNQFKAAVQQINLEEADAATVGDIDLFSAEDWDEIAEMNKDMPQDEYDCCHEVIHRKALDRSDAMAVNAWDVDLTYGELDHLSSRLAHHLRSLGVGPEVFVPLCFEKSGWAVVAVLGVIKAGGAFVFLDPAYPKARLNEIVSQVKAKVVLCSLASASLWQASGLTVQIVDNVAIESLPSVSGMPLVTVSPSNALFIIFTSGSSGTPKGAIVEHHNFLTTARAQEVGFNMLPSSRILQFASYQFDASVMEILTTLTVGACICVPNERAKARSIVDVVNDFRITWTFLTPSVAKLMKPADVPCLKTLILGGEAMTKQNVETWGGHVQLMNGYGPCECTISCSVNPNVRPGMDPGNVGKGLGAVAWITDPDNHNKLAPLGTIGELVIEGHIVSRGYLNNPEKTAEVFIQNPAWAKHEAGQPIRRMYKTGDLAYINTDGDVVFVGRKDTQVKVRGQRMELGEIETHLSLNKEIQHAMVMYPKAGLCKRQLVGIVSLKQLGASTNSVAAVELLDNSLQPTAAKIVNEITTELSAIVPGYMVPNMWIVVKSFPMMPSGKLNRKRVDQWLAHIDQATHHQLCGLGGSGSVRAPTSKLETELRGIWAEVLKLPEEEIGTTQDFTALGGDSILAMVVISKLRKKGSTITMNDMLKAKNILKLATLVAQGPQMTALSAATKEVEETTDELFDLSPVQQFYADYTLKETNYLSRQTNKRFHTTFCLRVKSPVAAKDLSRALDALVERHSMLRARFVRDPTAACGWRQYVSTKTTESYRFRAWDRYTIDQVKPSVEKARLSLDIEKGPIMAADLVTLEDGEQVFYMVAHHLVVDMISWNTLLRDLEELVLHGTCTNDKPYPFSAWARLQRDQALKALSPSVAYPLQVPAADFAYWGMADRLNIVRDVTHRMITIPERETTALMQNCAKQYGAEPMDILASALSQAFSLVFRDRNTPTMFRYSHGREPSFLDAAAVAATGADADVSQTVGWFSTLCPLQVRVRSRDDSLDVLRRAVETRQRIPANGWAYFASRYHHPEGRVAFAGHDKMEVSINYLGVADNQARNGLSLFEMPRNAAEGALGAEGQEVKCLSLFSVTAQVSEGSLQLQCGWNRRARGQDDIEQWFAEFERCLVDVARRAQAGHAMRRRVAAAAGVARRKYF